jgi:hypothetical protein
VEVWRPTRQAFWHCVTLVLGLGSLTIPYTLEEVPWAGLLVLAALFHHNNSSSSRAAGP